MTRQIQLPSGEIAEFPADTPDAEIEAALREHFRPAPAELEDGATMVRPNGSAIRANLGRYFITDPYGRAVGWRQTLVAACAIADAFAPKMTPIQREIDDHKTQGGREVSAAEIESRFWADTSRHIRNQHLADLRAQFAKRRDQRGKNYGV